jgi:hypothetical protein
MSDYDLVMPFVTVHSKGGPHDDESYIAGWTMGYLDAVLEHQKPAMHEDTIYQDSIPQADIIAMKHGYRTFFEAVFTTARGSSSRTVASGLGCGGPWFGGRDDHRC